MNIFKSFLIDLREFWSLLLEFEIEERMFFLEIEGIIWEIGRVAGSDGWEIVSEFGGMFVAVAVLAH